MFFRQLLIVCPLVFFAGLLDSIAGGGGIISLPAYMAAGLPAHVALGTNKFSSVWGTSLATFRFFKNGKIHRKIAAVSVPTALVGSACGARLALLLDERTIQYVLMIVLPVLGIFIITKRDFVTEASRNRFSSGQTLLVSGIAAFVIGGYDGFFGPGTGTFMMIVFNSLIGLDILTASGNTKAVNLASNLAAITTFLINGNVAPALGVPAALCSLLGNYLGSGMALKKGVKAIKPAFVCVLVLLLAKVGMDVWG